jgi:TolB-like protein/Flp pilus assembly protein TadD
MHSVRRLIHEVHRRSLWQVLAIYLAGAWVALQVVNEVTRSVGLPDWVSGAAVVLLVIGFPIVLATAFVQEGMGPRAAEEDGPTGSDEPLDGGPAKLARSRPDARAGRQRLFTWRNALAGGAGAFAVWGLVAAAWLLFGGGTRERAADGVGAPDPNPSIAVLPFVTRSEDPRDVYFAEGMHDDLLTQLAKIDSLTVISRTSVLQYANTTERIPVIARTLGVGTVLEGGVQRSGDRIRVNVQLIEAATDRHLWAETYDEELTAANVFAIQSDLARKIARALQATLSPAVARRIDARPTESLAAYDLFSRARYEYEVRGQYGEGLDAVIATYEQALAEDRGFAAAWSGLANAYLAAWNWNRIPPETAAARSREAITRAISLDPELAEAHLALARLLIFEDDTDLAEAEILRAIALNPGTAEAYIRYADVLEHLGRTEEAVRAARRAVELDPLSPTNRNVLADRLFYAGDFEAAIAESRRVIEMTPGDWYAWYNLAWSQAALERVDDAVDAFRQAGRLTRDNIDPVRIGTAYAFARGARRDSALAYIADADPVLVGYDIALVWFTLGDTDRAFADLEAILRANPATLGRLRRDPTAAPMLAHPDFDALVRRLNLE